MKYRCNVTLLFVDTYFTDGNGEVFVRMNVAYISGVFRDTLIYVVDVRDSMVWVDDDRYFSPAAKSQPEF